MNERSKVLELFEKQKDFMDLKTKCGIEMYRKGFGEITVTDSNGNKLSGAKIILKQKTHEFKFGANIFMLDELESEEKNEAYKKFFADTFNMATLPFYWDATEPEKGKTRYDKNSPKMYRRPSIDRCIEFCEKNGIEPREHALAYEGFFPKWLYGANVPEIKNALEKRYSEISGRYKNKINTIEVTNEMQWVKGRTAFYEQDDYVEFCFKLAEKYFPANQLVINEVTPLSWDGNCRTSDRYYSYIESNILKGARIDAIGMQYHMFWEAGKEYECTRPYYNPKNLYAHMDLYSKFGKPLQVTEVTVPAYSNSDEDEFIQAKILENLYTIWFSHPNAEQIVYWNLVDGYAHLWDPDLKKIRESQGNMSIGENVYYGGLLRFDMTPKPAYYTIKNLIEKKWHTDVDTVTDTDGKASFHGFYGDYDVTVVSGDVVINKTINLSSKSYNDFEIVI